MSEIDNLTKSAVLRIGEVSEINGRKIYIRVDKNKNLSDIFFDGDILTNISVNNFVEIKKGFLSIIGKVEGEKLEEENFSSNLAYEPTNRNKRYLTVALYGYIQNNKFLGGTKELPLIGNEAFLVTKETLSLVHKLADDASLSINVAKTEIDNLEIALPIDGLFNSHIAIFGNTGSGKSNTLAALYTAFVEKLQSRNLLSFNNNCKFLLFDFNGEYIGPHCITASKTVYNLSTRTNTGDKIPIDRSRILDLEFLSILCDATDKTQKPFIKRTLSLYDWVMKQPNPHDAFRNSVKLRIQETLILSDKIRATQIIDYFREVLPETYSDNSQFDVWDDITWHNNTNQFMNKTSPAVYFQSSISHIHSSRFYQQANRINFRANPISDFIMFMYLQLINDLLTNRAQNEHIAPAINKLRSKQNEIEKIFSLATSSNFWTSNFVIVNMNDINLDMKKVVPLLLSKKVYNDHKLSPHRSSLNIIIDEAHNILSHDSFREAESWKDYRLETFEEIIKEGRKFGVFVTISSQRPNDISPTIISQAHNYFIHRLLNQKDLLTISNAVSYIDTITEQAIPTLPTGTCIFSGVAGKIPLKISFSELPAHLKPNSQTLKFSDIVPAI